MTEDQINATIGRRIEIIRKRRGMTLGALGRHIGVTADQVYKYESGANRILAARLILIADALGVSPAAFYELNVDRRAA